MLHGLAIARDCIDIILQTLNLTKIIIDYDGRARGWEVYGGDGGTDCERKLIWHSGKSIDND